MRDQVAAATKAGLVAVTINSTNIDDWGTTLADVESGRVDVLLVSPERLANPAFIARMAPVIKSAGLIVIDEAHCISDWGFDFRPDYQRLTKVLTASPNTPVLATTATANARVTADVAAQLGPDTVVLRGSLARTSLHLSVIPGLSPLERYAWVDEALHSLEGSGIIYVPTVAETTRLSNYLISQGHVVTDYSGQSDVESRERTEDLLRTNQVKAVVATSALGMGYDKPDLGFTIHVGSPDSPVAYYQQVGRAGRAIDRAQAVLLPAETDERLWEYFATSTIPDPANIATVLEFLDANPAPASIPKITDATGVRRGRLESLLKIIAVEGAVERVEGGWASTGKGYVFDQEKWDSIVAARAAEAGLMRSYAAGAGCLMNFLQTALDDTTSGPCETCSVCTGNLPAPGHNVDPARVENARAYLRGVDVVLEPRKLWPSALASGRRGRIDGALEGRALAFADSPGWTEVAGLTNGPDITLPEAVVRGLVSVLTRWRNVWPQRPVAVIAMPSRAHPRMIADLAQQIATIGKMPLIDALELTGPPPFANAASAPYVDAIESSLHLLPNVVLPTDGPVILIDDAYRTGWSATVAAALLRDAGVSGVYPLVLHQLPS
jgi:ATP-dependent DNA helicase RecQ